MFDTICPSIQCQIKHKDTVKIFNTVKLILVQNFSMDEQWVKDMDNSVLRLVDSGTGYDMPTSTQASFLKNIHHYLAQPGDDRPGTVTEVLPYIFS